MAGDLPRAITCMLANVIHLRFVAMDKSIHDICYLRIWTQSPFALSEGSLWSLGVWQFSMVIYLGELRYVAAG